MLRLSDWFKEREMLKWGVAVLLLVIPLYMKFPLFRISGSFVSVRLEDFVVFGVFVLWLVTVVDRWREIFKSAINQAIFVYLLVALISVFSGAFLTKTISPLVGLFHWLRRVEYMGLFFIGVSSVKDAKNLPFYIRCILLVVIVAFLYGFGQKYLNFPVIMTQNAEYSKGVALRYTPGAHLISTFAGHYDLASYLVLVTPIFVGLIMIRTDLPKSVLAFSLFGSGWLLINSASRVSIVSFLLAVSVTLILMRRYIFIPLAFLIMAVWVAFSGNLWTRYNRIFDVVREKIHIDYRLPSLEVQAADLPTIALKLPAVLSATEDRSTNIRLNVEWPRAVRALTKNPILGTGFSSITLATDNDYLRALGETGVLGFLAFMLVIMRLVIELVRRLPAVRTSVMGYEQVFILALSGSLPGVLLNALFIDVFEASKFALMFWLLMGFLFGLEDEKV